MVGKSRGFTLIELLVVVAIIVLLIAILIPSFAKAKEQGKTIQCSVNQRGIGQLINIFSNINDGRSVGEAWTNVSSTPPFPQDWGDIINSDLMDLNTGGANTVNSYLYNNPAVIYGVKELQAKNDYAGFIRGKHFLVCPNFQPVGDWSRVYAINRDAAGGGGYNIPGTYGKLADPRAQSRSTTLYTAYAFGAPMKRFNPSQMLLTDTTYDFWFPKWPYATCTNVKNGQVNLNDDSAYPNYCGHHGELAFRHPYGKRGIFCFTDVHVEVLSPKDNIDSDNRWFIDGTYDDENANTVPPP